MSFVTSYTTSIPQKYVTCQVFSSKTQKYFYFGQKYLTFGQRCVTIFMYITNVSYYFTLLMYFKTKHLKDVLLMYFTFYFTTLLYGNKTQIQQNLD